jgi:hypothetical protein
MSLTVATMPLQISHLQLIRTDKYDIVQYITHFVHKNLSEHRSDDQARAQQPTVYIYTQSLAMLWTSIPQT